MKETVIKEVKVPYEVRVEVPVEVKVKVPVYITVCMLPRPLPFSSCALDKHVSCIHYHAINSTAQQPSANKDHPVVCCARRARTARLCNVYGVEWLKRLTRRHHPQFFERLMLFAEQSLKRREELIARIQGEQRKRIEEQLDVKHLLDDPNKPRNPDADLCLPSLFMPMAGAVYNPRATQYWHPAGSKDPRLTQPPSIMSMPELKLPPIPNGTLENGAPSLRPMNIFELSRTIDNLKRMSVGLPPVPDDNVQSRPPTRPSTTTQTPTTPLPRPPMVRFATDPQSPSPDVLQVANKPMTQREKSAKDA